MLNFKPQQVYSFCGELYVISKISHGMPSVRSVFTGKIAYPSSNFYFVATLTPLSAPYSRKRPAHRRKRLAVFIAANPEYFI